MVICLEQGADCLHMVQLMPLHPETPFSLAGWWRGSVVERRSLAGELSLSCARPAADG